eukprot:gene8822-7913_t
MDACPQLRQMISKRDARRHAAPRRSARHRSLSPAATLRRLGIEPMPRTKAGGGGADAAPTDSRMAWMVRAGSGAAAARSALAHYA